MRSGRCRLSVLSGLCFGSRRHRLLPERAWPGPCCPARLDRAIARCRHPTLASARFVTARFARPLDAQGQSATPLWQLPSMIVSSLLGSRFGRCAYRKAIREFCFIQNGGRSDSVICARRKTDRAPRYLGVVLRGSLAILVFSGPAYSQTLASGPLKASSEVSIAQVPAGLKSHAVGHRPVVAPAHPHSETTSLLTKMAEQVAIAHTLPTGYFLRLIRQESGFNPNSVSPTGAQGIAQFMPATASDRGLQDPFDPTQALPKSAELLNELRDKFGNLGLAAAAYNAGTDPVHNGSPAKARCRRRRSIMSASSPGMMRRIGRGRMTSR